MDVEALCLVEFVAADLAAAESYEAAEETPKRKLTDRLFDMAGINTSFGIQRNPNVVRTKIQPLSQRWLDSAEGKGDQQRSRLHHGERFNDTNQMRASQA